MSRFEFSPAPLSGVTVVKRLALTDDRGFFARLFCSAEFQDIGLAKPIVQINYTFTQRRGAVRGLHFQHPPHAEAKLVICLRGEVFDVAVDLRAESPTLLHWHGEVLSAANGNALYIPEGFAHGFQTLAEDCGLLYLHTEVFDQQAEGGVAHDDPLLAIAWPLPITDLSARDQRHPSLPSNFSGIRL